MGQSSPFGKSGQTPEVIELPSSEGESNQIKPPAAAGSTASAYLQATGLDPDCHILGITSFVFGLQGEGALVVILSIGVFFSILKKKTVLKMTPSKHNYILK